MISRLHSRASRAELTRIPRFLKRFAFLRSLRFRLVFTVVAIEAVMLTFLVWNYAVEIRTAHEDRLRRTAAMMLDQFVATAGPYLVARDLPALSEYARRVLNHDELTHIVVRDEAGGLILELRGPSPQVFGPREYAVRPELEMSAPIVFADRERGEVTVGLSRAFVQAAVAESRREGLMIAGAEILLSILAATAIGFALTRNLSGLTRAAQQFGRGESEVLAPVRGSDELSYLARAFNEMVAGRRLAEQQLRESEQWLRTVVESTPVALGIARQSDGTVLFANPRLGQLLGTEADRLLGRTFLDYYADPGHRGKFMELLRRDGFLRDYQNTLRKADGSSLEVLVDASLMSLGGEDVIVFGLHDVTEQNLMREQLIQSRKMEAVGQLTGGVAHDFNNILAVIVGNLDLVLMHERDETSKHRIGMAIRAAQNAASLTQQLLAFSRRQILSPATHDFKTVTRDIIELLSRTLGESVRIETRLDNDVWPVFIDASQLFNAIVNLALNARDAMPNGGTLTISASNVVIDAEGAARFVDAEPGGYVRIAITDTGAGMSPDVAAQVFEPFFTTKEIGKGSGLGLSMVFGFAQQSGGHVAIDTAPGRGTTVAIFLPRALRQSAASDEAASEPGTKTGRGETILVVEDDPLVRESVQSGLRELGYEVETASDGPTALAMLESGRKFDLLFTDIMLPGGKDGVELERLAAERCPGIKSLFVSGYPESALDDLPDSFDRSRLVTKPFRYFELSARIRGILDRG